MTFSVDDIFTSKINNWNKTKTHLCGLISTSSPMGPRSLFLLLLPQVMRVVVEDTKQYVKVVSVDVVDWVVT